MPDRYALRPLAADTGTALMRSSDDGTTWTDVADFVRRGDADRTAKLLGVDDAEREAKDAAVDLADEILTNAGDEWDVIALSYDDLKIAAVRYVRHIEGRCGRDRSASGCPVCTAVGPADEMEATAR